jgi:hypothetical protein
MGITSLMLEQTEFGRDAKQLTGASLVKYNAESLGLIMASSSLLLNLINNLLDVKKATANSKCRTVTTEPSSSFVLTPRNFRKFMFLNN